ncbi:unnamed protein product [Ectocarpus sp. 6 AP-2014]
MVLLNNLSGSKVLGLQQREDNVLEWVHDPWDPPTFCTLRWQDICEHR